MELPDQVLVELVAPLAAVERLTLVGEAVLVAIHRHQARRLLIVLRILSRQLVKQVFVRLRRLPSLAVVSGRVAAVFVGLLPDECLDNGLLWHEFDDLRATLATSVALLVDGFGHCNAVDLPLVILGGLEHEV